MMWGIFSKIPDKINTFQEISSNSTFENNVYRTAFWEDTEIWMMGHARNDILFEKDPQKIDAVRQKVYRELNIPSNVRLALYAPTFRPYTLNEKLDAGKLVSYLESSTGEEWRLLERAHMRETEKYTINREKVVNAFGYNDIQELMLVADIGITDYSSWIFDYMLTGKPGFIFAPDLERYADARGFYYPIETTPFPIAEDTDALIEKLRSFDEPLYRKNVDAFLREKGCMDDGHAAERIVDALENIIAAKQEENCINAKKLYSSCRSEIQ
jgi:CDP-glycerol glycerophosphotransferase